jgi:septal ring factor EnvC (AmiA/AmiB activator)
LVVAPPEPPAARAPLEEISKLLRTELSILEAAETLEFNIARRTGELKTLRRQLDVVERDLARTTSRFEAQTAALEAARALIRKRLRTIVQLRRVEPYQLLFGASQWGRFELRLRALGKLLEADKARVAQYRERLERWRQAKVDLERRRTNLARTEQQIGFLLKELDWDRQEKEGLLEAVRDKAAYLGKVTAEMEGVDRQLAERVESLRDHRRKRLWFEENKARLIRKPVRGAPIIARYGRRTHKKLKTETFNPGLDFGPPPGWNHRGDIDVVAIYYGYVVHAGWLRGLGNTVILDHTRGYTSLYAHLDRIDVKVGQRLTTGDTLGTMGDSGSLSGTLLHLEIRRDGKTLDPFPWLR